MNEQRIFGSFEEFYPFYLAEHSNRTSRRLHFLGSTLALVLLVTAVVNGNLWLLLLALVQAYALAWIGHFCFEHNRPATFQHPWWSFRGDWRMWSEIVSGRRKL